MPTSVLDVELIKLQALLRDLVIGVSRNKCLQIQLELFPVSSG